MSKTSQSIDVGDIQLHVVTAGEGPAVMFLHGLGWDHHLWDGAFERYSDRHHIIAGDTRGHGQSGQPHTPYSIGLFAEDWLTALDQLQVEQAILVGFSQGGMVAMEMAIRQPERFPALVLACTTCCTPLAVSDNMQQRIDLLDQLGPLEAAKLASQSIFSASFIEQNPDYVQQFIQQRAGANQTALKQSMLAVTGFDVCTQLEALSQPCLVIAGADDRLIPPTTVAAIHHHLPQSRFVCIPSTGHMIPIEQPHSFYRCLDEVLCLCHSAAETA